MPSLKWLSSKLHAIWKNMLDGYSVSEKISREKEKLTNTKRADTGRLRELISGTELPLVRVFIGDTNYLLGRKQTIMKILVKALGKAKQEGKINDAVGMLYQFRVMFDFLEKILPYLKEAGNLLEHELALLKQGNFDMYKQAYEQEYGLSDAINPLFHKYIENNVPVTGPHRGSDFGTHAHFAPNG